MDGGLDEVPPGAIIGLDDETGFGTLCSINNTVFPIRVISELIFALIIIMSSGFGLGVDVS